MTDFLSNELDLLRNIIIKEVKDNLISIKFDYDTKFDTHFFRINIQFVINSEVRMKNLDT